jgi:dTDP-4-amino-4,6-dideoxygalactose transaminase
MSNIGTFSIDPEAVAAALTDRTRAVLVIHYGGIACDLDRLATVLGSRDIAIIEDNAHGLFGSYKARKLGSFGRFSTMSFHETKNVHCGEGGGLALNVPGDLARAEIVREKGTNRSAFFRGAVAKYQWVDVGSSYVIGDVLAAFLCAQLERADDLQKRRGILWRRYHDGLARAVASLGWQRPIVPDYAESAHHLYFLVAESAERRAEFITFLGSRGIHAAFHYQALHRSPFAVERGFSNAACPNSDIASDRLVRLPLYGALADADQERVIEAVHAFADA